jgi:FMN phosphatase YigB (HAD superfamily)
MSKRNLLLCFDAFGTLIRPVRPVAQQYADVARQCGFTNFNDDELQAAFKSSFKQESKKNPNYGKDTGLGATNWWTNVSMREVHQTKQRTNITQVIHKTFTSLAKDDKPLPKDLAPKLLHRFASKEGYETESGLVEAFKKLKQNPPRDFNNIVVGVITNSDDRIPSILSSLGLAVSPLRYGTYSDLSKLKDKTYDIDFHCMSYDVGVEKPDKRIFSAAEHMLAQVISARSGKTLGESERETSRWQKMYVGDDYSKDVLGSANAGWNPVLLDPKDDCENIADLKHWRSSANGSPEGKVCKIEDHSNATLDGVFQEYDVVTVHSIRNLLSWLSI